MMTGSRNERKRIEDEYTFPINNFGRVILYNDREAFDKAAERFRVIVEKYQTALRESLPSLRANFVTRIVDEFLATMGTEPAEALCKVGH